MNKMIHSSLNEEFLLKFMSAYFDEYVLRPSGQSLPIMDARTIRSLGAAIGDSYLWGIMKKLQNRGLIKIIQPADKSESSEPIIEIIDYVI